MLIMIRAFIEAVKQGLSTYEASIKNQTTSEVVHDRKLLKRASNITEDILLIVDKYVDTFEENDKKQYERLKRKFLKVN